MTTTRKPGPDTVASDGTEDAPFDMPNLSRGVNLGRYVVLDVVGAGGMGVVYAAYDSGLDRKVAVKLLRNPADGEVTEARQSRLLREAQAMAQVSSPYVNVVHDVGAFRGRVYVAMELVDGVTITEWLRQSTRSCREICDVFCQTALGLAAAHAADLVHRDVKPENILVGHDGRVRVTDFGLVSYTPDPAANADDADTPIAGALSQSITRTSMAVGTPRYMAPEQHQSEPATARSDQFGFCVALYEALYGEHPFAGADETDLVANVISGRVGAAPAGSQAPSWLRNVVVRGLLPDPSKRHADMAVLADELRNDPVRLRWRIAAAVGAALVVAVAAGAGVYALNAESPSVCRGAERHLDGVWDAGRKISVKAGLLATQAPFAPAGWREVERTVDEYLGRWVERRTDACRATHIHGEQSPAVLDLRMRCFDRRLREVNELLDLFSAADADTIKRAPRAVHKLSDLALCDNGEQLSAPIALPADADARARIDAIDTRIARIKALQAAGKYKDALVLARKTHDEFADLDHGPTRARLLFSLAVSQRMTGDYVGAEPLQWEAIFLATASRNDELASNAWRDLLGNVGEKQARYEEAERWIPHAQAAADRTGSEAQRGRLAFIVGAIRIDQGRHADAISLLEQSRAEAAARLGPDHERVTLHLNALAIARRELGQWPEAIALWRQALAIRQRTLGDKHPAIAILHGNLGVAFADRGMAREALPYHQKAMAIFEAAGGPDNYRIGIELINLARALGMLGRHEEAIGHLERALAINRKHYRPNHPMIAHTLFGLASAHAAAGRHNQALGHLDGARAIREQTFGRDHHSVATALCSTAESLIALDRHREAMRAATQCRKLLEQKFGEESNHLEYPLRLLAELDLERGTPARSIAPLEKGLATWEDSGNEQRIALARFALARVLWAAKRDRSRALGLAEQALASFVALESGTEAAEIETWLSARR